MADRDSSRRKKENRAVLSDTCVDYYILLLQNPSTHVHFITNGYRMLFKDQLDRSKATYSFNPEVTGSSQALSQNNQNF